MTSQSPAPTVATLNVKECWELLRKVSVARLAVVVGDHPEVFPINYAVDGGTLIFRSSGGTKLDAALAGPVAVEADGVDPETGTAWSVMIRAHAEPVSAADELLDTVAMRLFPWHGGSKEHFVRIIPTDVSGRLFTVVSPAVWWSPLDGAPHGSPE
jgi:nitroimidazol reductase NimA-like FMN-containing flavoprotein (pyridoxamine 5'-phosphate oxidase superfamily)